MLDGPAGSPLPPARFILEVVLPGIACCVCMYVYMYTYIYIYREREREIYTHTHTQRVYNIAKGELEVRVQIVHRGGRPRSSRARAIMPVFISTPAAGDSVAAALAASGQARLGRRNIVFLQAARWGAGGFQAWRQPRA